MLAYRGGAIWRRTAVDSWKHLGDRVHSKHPKKEVNEVLDYADMLGHKVEQTAAGHKWGRITCSLGHRVSVWSTPCNPGNHARDLRKWVDQHVHAGSDD